MHLLLLLCAKQLLLHLLLALALAFFGPCAPPSPPWHAQRAAATARVLVGFARHSVPGKYIGRRGVCDGSRDLVVVVAAEVVVAGVLREQGGRLARAKWVGSSCHSPFERLLL